MSGLILQDLFAMKKVIKTYVGILLFYIILGVMNNQVSQFSAFFVFFSIFLSVSAFSYREKNKWDMNAAIMPIARNEMVKATYFMSYGFLLVAVVCVLGLNVVDMIGKNMTSDERMQIFGVTGGIVFSGIGYVAIMLPILFKFGVEKGRLFVTACFMIPFVVVMFVTKSGMDLERIERFIAQRADLLPVVLGTVAVLVSVLSYYISVKIYDKKEF